MLYYIIFGIILATILLAFLINIVHSSREQFKKKVKVNFSFYNSRHYIDYYDQISSSNFCYSCDIFNFV